MKVNELEIYKALKVLTESGYIVSENQIITENRTFDVEELVTKYKERIMKLLKQKLSQMLDKVYDGDEVDKTITIEIPALMVPVTYRPEPVRMKALTVKLYGSKTDIRNDYNAQKGPGKGALYANAMGDTNPDTDPVILMINLPNVISSTPAKPKNKITEGKYTSRKSNLIPFPETREEVETKKKTKKSKKSATTGRTLERDALFNRFRDKYGFNDEDDYYYGGYGGNYGGNYGYGGYGYGGSYSYYDDSFNFKDAVEEAEAQDGITTPMQVVDKIIEDYFGDYFQEVLHHELTHFIQANNKQLDGTEDAHDYDAHAVIASGAYGSDELEYEAKLHQKLPEYIDAIQKSKNSIAKIAKNLVSKLYSNQFNKLSKDKQHKYYNEILSFCQVIKTHPEITKYNFNRDKFKKLLRDAL